MSLLSRRRPSPISPSSSSSGLLIGASLLPQLRGTNLTGGDTFWKNWASKGGPVAGEDYEFVATKDVDYCLSKGMNTFRLVFGWEALQPQAAQNILQTTGPFATYRDRLFSLVKYITSKGAFVLLDIHGGDDSTFAAYYGAKVGDVYGRYAVSDLLVNLWKQLANIFKSNSYVMFGITNEPSGLPTMTWFQTAQKVIDGIRTTGARNVIVMPGNYFSGAGSWTYTGGWGDTGKPAKSNGMGWDNANGAGKPLRDPINNTWIQVHLYVDPDGGGGTGDIQSARIGADRLKVVTDWARTRGLKVFVGEVAMAASNPLAKTCWQNLVSYIDANRDVVQGFTWWAYGVPAWWGSYIFTLAPSANYTKDSPQMALIRASFSPSLLPSPPAPAPIPSSPLARRIHTKARVRPK